MIEVRLARLLATIGVLACACVTIPARADHHTDAECREGGEFIGNAARSRDAGMARDAFMARLTGDLVTIRAFPRELRWFARDESDEQLLIEFAGRVFDRPAEPAQHEVEFLRACTPSA
jgi:hypothetical protein